MPSITRVLPSKNFYDSMKESNEKPSMMFQLITRNLLRKYFTLSYHNSGEYGYVLNADKTVPVILEAWKKGRRGQRVEVIITQEEADIIYEITSAM